MSDKEKKFEKAYLENKDKIYRLCLGFTGNAFDADDLLQEVLIRIWNSIDSFRGESKISTWIYRIASNTAILFAKRKSKLNSQQTRLETYNEPIVTNNEDSSLREQEINRLYAAISTLQEIDRILIGLLLEGSSYNEISEITGLTSTNVGARISRIKKKLNKKLEP